MLIFHYYYKIKESVNNDVNDDNFTKASTPNGFVAPILNIYCHGNWTNINLGRLYNKISSIYAQ